MQQTAAEAVAGAAAAEAAARYALPFKRKMAMLRVRGREATEGDNDDSRSTLDNELGVE